MGVSMKNKYFISIVILIMAFMVFSCKESTEPNSNNNNNNGIDPLILNITPNSTYAGYPLEITGNNFGFEQNEGFVEINGEKVSKYIYWSYTKIIILIPDLIGSGKVTVTSNGKTSNGLELTIKQPSSGNPPRISFFDTDKPFVRKTVGIEGSYFGDEKNDSYVTFNGVIAYEYTSWRDKKIVAVIPTGATSGNVIVYVNGQASNPMHLDLQTDVLYLEQVLIHGGKFMMGAEDEPNAFNTPVHEVTITQPFYMSKYEITQGNWENIVFSKEHNSHNKGVDNPVERVSWIDACLFCNSLSNREGFNKVYTINGDEVLVDWEANGYRLPTEAEWELAARAGGQWKYGLGKDGQNATVHAIAWHNENADNSTHEIGLKEPNQYGLYDMLGNVSEWCWDWYDADYYSAENNNIDPKGSYMQDAGKVLRGGSYIHDKAKTTCSYRWGWQHSRESEYYIGFRVVRNAR
jgi:formylglycine-generating enzyme